MTTLITKQAGQAAAQSEEQRYYRYLPFFRVNQRVIHYLLIGYFLLVPTGSLVRFVNDDRQGLTTLLLGGLLILNLALATVVLPREPIYIVLMAFGLWSLTLTVYGALLGSAPLIAPFMFIGYLLLSASMAYYAYYVPPSTISKYYLVAAASGALFSLATLADYYGSLGLGLATVELQRIGSESALTNELAGQFNSRSTYGGVIALLAPAWFVMTIESRNRWHSLLYALATAGTVVLLLNAHHRMIVLVMAVTVLVYALGNASKYKRRWLLVGLVVATAGWFVINDSNLTSVLTIKFREALSPATAQGRSDLIRVELLQISLGSLLRNPIGNGWSKLPLSPLNYEGAHSAYTHIIWAGGLLGLVVLIVSALLVLRLYGPLYRRASQEQKRLARPLVYSMLGWAVFAMGHQGLSIAASWILLGLLIGLLRSFSVEGQG